MVYSDRGVDHYTDADCMARNLSSSAWGGYHLFAHNLPYDLQNIFGEFLPISGCLIGSSLYFATLKVRESRNAKGDIDNSSCIHFRDSVRHYPARLAELGRKLDLPKLWAESTDLDSLSDEDIANRCQHDALIVYEFVRKLQITYNELGTSLNATIGSSALELYRRQYMTRSYKKLDEVQLVKLNQAYYGGRCEAFYLGELPPGDYKMGDVNSMYPAVMRDLVVGSPSKEHVRHRENPSAAVLELSGASYCTVQVPPMMYPPLPWKAEKQGKLLFPVGRFSGWWCHNELEYAVSLGVKIRKVHESIWFTETCQPFLNYVDDLYQLKLQGGWKELVAKLLLNNTYGKFAMSRPPAKLIPADEYLEERIRTPELFRDPQAVDEIRDKRGRLRAVVIKPEGYFFPRHSNQIWAAYITAAARIKLHSYLVNYGAYYCDTDSVLTTATLPITKELGVLSLQQTCTGATLKGPKAYALHSEKEKVRVKGVPNRPGWCRDGTTGEWLETADLQAMALDGKEIAFDAPLKLVEGFRKKSVPLMRKTPEGRWEIPETQEETRPNIWYTHTKQLRFVSDKRILRVGSGGWTDPIILKG